MPKPTLLLLHHTGKKAPGILTGELEILDECLVGMKPSPSMARVIREAGTLIVRGFESIYGAAIGCGSLCLQTS